MLTQFKNSKRARLSNFEESMKSNEFDRYIEYFGYEFKRSLTSKKLNLKECDLSEADCLSFVIPFLMENPEISSLNLHNNGIGYRSLVAIAFIDSIVELDVGMNNLNDECARAISNSKSIKKLILCENDISDIGAAYLAKNTVCDHIDVSGNPMTDLGLGRLDRSGKKVIRKW